MCAHPCGFVCLHVHACLIIMSKACSLWTVKKKMEFTAVMENIVLIEALPAHVGKTLWRRVHQRSQVAERKGSERGCYIRLQGARAGDSTCLVMATTWGPWPDCYSYNCSLSIRPRCFYVSQQGTRLPSLSLVVFFPLLSRALGFDLWHIRWEHGSPGSLFLVWRAETCVE